MKRILTCLLALTMLLALTAPAFADVLWEPMDDRFYEDHRGSCQYEGRSYYANGKDGFVTAWDAPGGSIVKAQYENGEKLWVGYTYKNWALISRWDGSKETTGWVPMADLYLIYDHISFEEEYGDQFRDYAGEFADYAGEAGEEFWFWEYPNAGEPREILTINEMELDALRGTAGQPSWIFKVYTDENGLNWGYVGYLYGIRHFWILLDNPTGDGIMTSCIPKADELIYNGELTAPQEPTTPALPVQAYLPYALVAGVVAVTAGLLGKFWKKKK